MSKLPPIKPYQQRMVDESNTTNGAWYYMWQEIEELRERVAVLEKQVPRTPEPCEDPECGDGYGCICYTR